MHVKLETMFLLIAFAFIAGILTILAPCIWPILPIALSSSIAGGGMDRKRPIGVVIGLVLSFTIFTLAITTIVKLLNLPPDSLRHLAIFTIGLLGLAMIIPSLGLRFEETMMRVMRRLPVKQNFSGGFWPGFVTGVALGSVWAPCAGPILAAVAALSATGQVTSTVVLITFSFACGVAVPMLLLMLGGQTIAAKAGSISRNLPKIQQAFGVVMILLAIAMWFNIDRTLQGKVIEMFPGIDSSINKLERSEGIRKELNKLQNRTESADYGMAPEFKGISTWLNSEPLTIESLKGKVVLVDFWTYTCINCIRTLPHVTNWYETYKDLGFVVVGVHTPEFAFEKETENVARALKQYKINYPVALDNEYATWNAYNNLYWPAHYLIDADGRVRYIHFGEGNYDETEAQIKALLAEAGKDVDKTVQEMPDETPKQRISPETYLGSARMQTEETQGNLGKGSYQGSLVDPSLDNFSLGGSWNIDSEYAESGSDAKLNIRFKARQVFLVMHPPTGSTGSVKVLLDGQPISAESSGSDTTQSLVTVTQDKLYALVKLSDVSEHLLTLEFQTSGLKAYAFTFGD